MPNENILQVRFTDHNGRLRGRHRDFTKIAFISKHYTGQQPGPNELWDTRVIFDTMPDNPRKGMFYLMPLHRTGAAPTAESAPAGDLVPLIKAVMTEARGAERRAPTMRTEWDIATEKSGGGERVRVTWTQLKGDRVVRTQSWQVTRFDQVHERWAPRVQAQVRGALTEINARIAAATTASLEGALSQPTRQTPPTVPESRPLQELFGTTKTSPLTKGRLVDPVAIEVVSIEPFEHHVSRQGNGAFRDGVRIGALHSCQALRGDGAAAVVHGRRILLSNGESFEICSDELSITLRIVQDGHRRHVETETVFASCRKLDLVDRLELTWEEAERLTVGDIVGHEFRFQWVGDRLTNGKVWIPRQRPRGSAEWAKLPIPALPPELWDAFLTGLEGKFLAELIPFQARVRESVKVEKEQKLSERQNALRKVVNAYMWNGGGEGCERVAIGETGNVIFHVTRSDGRPLYFLDNAGVGSFYIFDNLDEATSVANGTVTRTEARKRFRHIDHRAGWEDDVTKLLRSE